MDAFNLTNTIKIGDGQPLVVLAGPCVAESLDICRTIAEKAAAACQKLALPYVFKASFDKANRTSINSFRGNGMEKGLEILAAIKKEFGCPVVTDVHEPEQCAPVAEVVDILQIPAFLCRQTDLLLAAAKTGKPVNVKKGQFLAPEDMKPIIGKIASTGNAFRPAAGRPRLLLRRQPRVRRPAGPRRRRRRHRRPLPRNASGTGKSPVGRCQLPADRSVI